MLPEITNPAVATALREHREDRDALLANLTASLYSDARVRAAWLWGSFGRGEADDFSDLDPWIIVSDEFAGEMGPSLRQYAKRTGNFISGGEAPQNGPPGGGFFASLHEGRHGLLHVDCYWQPRSAINFVPEHAVLIDRLSEPHAGRFPIPTLPAPSDLTEPQARIVSGIGFGWMMLSIAAKTLARYPDSDMSLMRYPRPGLEEAALLLDQEGYFDPSDWIAPENPLAKLALLRRLTDKVAQLTDLANEQSLALSPKNAVCLSRYLDMIAGILT